MKIEVDVEIALGVEFVGNSGRRIILSDVPLAFVAEEARKGLVHRAGKFRFVGFLVIGSNAFARQVWIGNVFLSYVRRVADDDIETAFIVGKDFDEGDVPDKW